MRVLATVFLRLAERLLNRFQKWTGILVSVLMTLKYFSSGLKGTQGKMVPTKIIIHCTDSPNGKDYSLEQLTKDHLARGFDGVGYHIYIDMFANAHNTRPLNVVGAHCLGENASAIGIALCGCDKFAQKQFNVLRDKIQAIMQLYSIKDHELYCHYQFPSAVAQGKTCPNIPINNLLYWYNTHDEKAISDWKLLEDK